MDDEDDGQEPAPSSGFAGLDLIPPTLRSAPAGGPLDQLRLHPQFNDLRQIVQADPTMLQQVIQQIGAQSPAVCLFIFVEKHFAESS